MSTRERHFAWPMAEPKPPSTRCAGCIQEWPCDAIREADRADERTRWWNAASADANIAHAGWAAAKADAVALATALAALQERCIEADIQVKAERNAAAKRADKAEAAT